jgi:PKD repeat protein
VYSSPFEVDATASVYRVVDGDTFDAFPVGRVRLADVDAPEIGEAGYTKATNALKSLVLNKKVYLDVDDLNVMDRYNRIVCVVYVRNNSTHLMNVNHWLVINGYAKISDYPNEFNPYTWSLYVYYPVEWEATATITVTKTLTTTVTQTVTATLTISTTVIQPTTITATVIQPTTLTTTKTVTETRTTTVTATVTQPVTTTVTQTTTLTQPTTITLTMTQPVTTTKTETVTQTVTHPITTTITQTRTAIVTTTQPITTTVTQTVTTTLTPPPATTTVTYTTTQPPVTITKTTTTTLTKTITQPITTTVIRPTTITSTVTQPPTTRTTTATLTQTVTITVTATIPTTQPLTEITKTITVTAKEATSTPQAIRLESGESKAIIRREARIPIRLSEAPNGLSGFELILSVNPSVALIKRVEFPGFGLNESSGAPGSKVSIKAVDINNVVKPGDTNPELAVLVIEGISTGEAALNIEVKELDDDNGNPIYAEVKPGRVVVLVSPPPLPAQREPRDLDGDGLFEDLNGNGRLDFADVVLFFKHKVFIEANWGSSLTDFNGNGRLDFDDIVRLFRRV